MNDAFGGIQLIHDSPHVRVSRKVQDVQKGEVNHGIGRHELALSGSVDADHRRRLKELRPSWDSPTHAAETMLRQNPLQAWHSDLCAVSWHSIETRRQGEYVRLHQDDHLSGRVGLLLCSTRRHERHHEHANRGKHR
jgi:hypothetical protein